MTNVVVGAAAAVSGGRHVFAATNQPLVVSMTTCRRPHGVSYLEGSLKAVDADLTAYQRLLICDGEFPEALTPGWLPIVLPQQAKRNTNLPDNKQVGWVAIRFAAMIGADLLFLEDDIRPLQAGAFSSMVAHQVPDQVAFTSFFRGSMNRPEGIHPAGEFQMSQAVKIPLRSLQVLARANEIDRERWQGVTGVDIEIAEIGSISHWKFEQTGNLIEHIGLWSASHPNNDPNR
jgi:hypothetical protein